MSRRLGCPECCAQSGCLILLDDFERADSTNLGSDWDEIAGDSEIVSGEVSIPTSGIIATDSSIVSTNIDQFVYGKIKTIATGKKYRIICNYNNSGSYIAGELETYTSSSSEQEVEPDLRGEAYAECEAGDLVTGGGYVFVIESPGCAVVEENFPEDLDSWLVTVKNQCDEEVYFTAWAVCAHVTPPE